MSLQFTSSVPVCWCGGQSEAGRVCRVQLSCAAVVLQPVCHTAAATDCCCCCRQVESQPSSCYCCSSACCVALQQSNRLCTLLAAACTFSMHCAHMGSRLNELCGPFKGAYCMQAHMLCRSATEQPAVHSPGCCLHLFDALCPRGQQAE